MVTLTHDPKLDDPALDRALRSQAFYIGSLGSKKTHAARLQRLSEAGFDDAALARIHGPAGLAIGAKSPAEIAVSVLAQLTAARHGQPDADDLRRTPDRRMRRRRPGPRAAQRRDRLQEGPHPERRRYRSAQEERPPHDHGRAARSGRCRRGRGRRRARRAARRRRIARRGALHRPRQHLCARARHPARRCRAGRRHQRGGRGDHARDPRRLRRGRAGPDGGDGQDHPLRGASAPQLDACLAIARQKPVALPSTRSGRARSR